MTKWKLAYKVRWNFPEEVLVYPHGSSKESRKEEGYTTSLSLIIEDAENAKFTRAKVDGRWSMVDGGSSRIKQ